ncbi:MAG: hypothetical protein H6779_03415 [Candidatus Nomurabacteria bacterium]|nr:hypothetical protein [Candidatus Nomurabacteria bacterium]USN87436.1 MAG: hypothetical protein H6779_03415 [Candidatus Nomurabacteria bacterium]
MLFVSILHHYLLWHYSKAFAEIFHVWNNFFWFVVHFFSLPQLVKSYFAPWKRIVEDRGKKFNFEDWAGYIIIGIVSRIIGIILRTIVILVGTALLVLLCVGIVVVYLFWLFAPAFLVASLVYGFVLMFSYS